MILELWPQNNPEVHDFLRGPGGGCRGRAKAALPATKLPTSRRSASRRRAGGGWPLVLVTENEPAFFQIIGRHFDRNTVACQRFDPVLLHFPGSIGNDLVSGIELHAIARVGEDFGDQSFELDQLFFSHGSLQIDRRLAWLLIAVGALLRLASAVQKGDALDSFGVAAAFRRPLRLLTVAVQGATITTRTTATARAFRARRSRFIAARRVRPRSRPSTVALLRGRSRRLAMPRRAAVLARQRDADQPLDVPQIAHL